MSFLIVSLVRGEFKDAWAWTDEVEDKAEPKNLAKSHTNGKVQHADEASTTKEDAVDISAEAPPIVENDAAVDQAVKKRTRRKRD